MFITKSLSRTRLHLAILSVSAFSCLVLSAYTHIDAANALLKSRTPKIIAHAPQTVVPARATPAPTTATTKNPVAAALHILSPKDEALYRAIFAAHAKGNITAADTALANLTDKRLVGHALADRYLRHGGSIDALRGWLETYGDHPEATDLYDLLKNNPAAKGLKITEPSLASIWTGSDDYGSSFGFRTENTLKPAPHKAETQGRKAAGLFFADKIDEAHKVATTASTQSPLALWIAGLSAWKKNDIAAATGFFSKLADDKNLSSWDRAAAAFWTYRAMKRAGFNDHAYAWLRQAAEQPRSFYGALANELLGRKTNWAWQLPEPKPDDIAALAQIPAGGRALALAQIGQASVAEKELIRLNPRGRRGMQEAMLYLANTAGMPSLALRLGGMATKNGKPYDAALYPLPPWQPENGYTVDRALIYAMMRHESRFDPTAISDRGACGLMQVMPSTARFANSTFIPSNENTHCADNLLDPAVNIDTGQKYVRMLSKQPAIGDNLLLLLAAYNGGPNKINRWMDDDAKRDPLLFIESLPVRETRDYVQRVMLHYWTYRSRLAEPETAIAQLARGEWPRYTLRDEPVLASPHHKPSPKKGFEIASNIDTVP